MDSLFDEPSDAGAGGGFAAGPRRAPAGASLATRIRPTSLEDFAGQTHLLAPGSALATAIAAGRPHSMILYGPPGVGKTTLARIVASAADAVLEEHSAVSAGRAEVRAVIERAQLRRGGGLGATVFFLDEIHRFNKAQQDALLPAVEDGLLILIGATTENPYFEVNSALLSRVAVYELTALTGEEVRSVLERALQRGEVVGEVNGPALDFLSESCGGDLRGALNALELACATAGAEPVTLERARDALRRRAILYDARGEAHYDYASALIKSLRGSDADAALYYLAVMLEGGEDPRFVARRMVVLASEDIGNADPGALQTAVAAAAAVEHVGSPECSYALAQCAIALALAPKSNADARALWAARRLVRERGASPPPAHLRSAGHPGVAAGLGRGVGYEYPHDMPGGVTSQPLLPDDVAGSRFYEP